MAVEDQDNLSPGSKPSDEVARLIADLTEQDRLLIVCNYELYGGRWDLLKADLVDRLEGKPCVFVLGERIKEDIERADHLEQLEHQHEFKFCDFVKF